MRHIISTITKALRRDEQGAGLVEYVLLLALIAAVCIGSLQYFGSGTGGNLNNSSECIAASSNQQSLPAHC